MLTWQIPRVTTWLETKVDVVLFRTGCMPIRSACFRFSLAGPTHTSLLFKSCAEKNELTLGCCAKISFPLPRWNDENSTAINLVPLKEENPFCDVSGQHSHRKLFVPIHRFDSDAGGGNGGEVKLNRLSPWRGSSYSPTLRFLFWWKPTWGWFDFPLFTRHFRNGSDALSPARLCQAVSVVLFASRQDELLSHTSSAWQAKPSTSLSSALYKNHMRKIKTKRS
jgi:hypothetical protein